MSSQGTSFNSDITNGLLFRNTYLPAEVIVNILTFLKWEDVLFCRLVCNSWKEIIDTFVGIEKVRKFHDSQLKSSFTRPTCPEFKLSPNRVPFYLYFAIGRNAFGNNHIKNPFGKDCPKFREWKILRSGGDRWVTEDPPLGSDPIPNQVGTTSCFVTSYTDCLKEQLINLQQCGLNCKIMDEIQPHIEVSEWFAKRHDCGIIYKMHVTLLNAEKEVVDEFTKVVVERQGDTEWHQISHTFEDYGPGVRYILFCHGGKDTKYWAGHYGSKMTGSSVIARIPIYLFAQTPES